jgi:adenylate cyclase
MQRLARSIAPDPLAASLQRGEIPAPAQYADVTAVVARFEGADALASRLPGEITRLVGQALNTFERRARSRGFVLTRMTDRSYTAIAGAPEWQQEHPRLAAELAIELRDCFLAELAVPLAPLNVKFGLHTGLLTVGIAGDERLVFGLWGDAVATADAIAASAPLGRVLLSNATSTRLGDAFVTQDPLILEVPGRGSVPTRALKHSKDAPIGTGG